MTPFRIVIELKCSHGSEIVRVDWKPKEKINIHKHKERRNREAMEQNGYTEESYEAWRDNAPEKVGIPDIELPKKTSMRVKAGQMVSFQKG